MNQLGFLKAGDEGGQQCTVSVLDEADAPRTSAHKLLCRSCLTYITSVNDVHLVDGAWRHTFVNPSGIVFQIGTFVASSGADRGLPTHEFSWFSGIPWAVHTCTRCGQQLGWHYFDTTDFYGLILDRLVEESTS